MILDGYTNDYKLKNIIDLIKVVDIIDFYKAILKTRENINNNNKNNKAVPMQMSIMHFIIANQFAQKIIIIYLNCTSGINNKEDNDLFKIGY